MLASESGYNCLQCPICARGFFHNINAWDIVEVDIFKGRSDPRIGGGSPTSLLRPRVGGRTRPSEFFLTSAPSASLPPGYAYMCWCWSPYIMCWTALCPLATSDRSRLRKDEGWGPEGFKIGLPLCCWMYICLYVVAELLLHFSRIEKGQRGGV